MSATDSTITKATWSSMGLQLEILTPWSETRTLVINTARLQQAKTKAELLDYIQNCVARWKAERDLKDSVDSMALVGEKITEKASPP